MEDNRKKYKIEKIEKYGQEWHEIKEHLKEVYKIGFAGLATAFLGGAGFKELIELTKFGESNYILAIVIIMLTGGSFTWVMAAKEAIFNLVDKHKLEKKIDKLDAALLEIEKEEKNNIRGGR